MAVAIFNYCALNKTPVLHCLMSEEEFAARAPKMRGSRSGSDGEYGIVTIKGEGLMGAFRRTQVYVGLTRENIPQMRKLGLRF